LSDTSEPKGVDAFSSFTEEQLNSILEVAKVIEEMGGNTKLITLCDAVGGNALEKIRLAKKSGVVTSFDSFDGFDETTGKSARWYTVNSNKLSGTRNVLNTNPKTTEEDDSMAVGAEKVKGPVTLLLTMRKSSPDNSLMEKESLVEALTKKDMGWAPKEERQKANALISNNVASGKVTRTATGQLKISVEGRKYLEEKLAEFPELGTSDSDDAGGGTDDDDLDELARRVAELVKSEKIHELLIFEPDAINALAEHEGISAEKSEKVWRRAEELKLIEIANDEENDTLIWLPENKGEGTVPAINVLEYVKGNPGILFGDLAKALAIKHDTTLAATEGAVQEAIGKGEIIKVDGGIYLAGNEPKPEELPKVVTLLDKTLGTTTVFTREVDLVSDLHRLTVDLPDALQVEEGNVTKVRFIDGAPTVVHEHLTFGCGENGLVVKKSG